MNKKGLRAPRLAAIIVCIALILWGVVYIVQWERTRARIEQENAMWSALYAPAATLAPTAAPTSTALPTIAAKVSGAPTAQPTPTDSPSPSPTLQPTPTDSPSPSPAVPSETQADFLIAVDSTHVPLSTADANTLVYALETPPPEQFAFGDLLALNPDTVGFIRLDDVLSLPVVQKKNNNEYYLDHSFNGEESIAGTLFLDGSNLLSPEDDALIIYGHNMRNGTMFRQLIRYEQLSFLKEHPLLHFDTIYEDRVWAPFAVFTLTADTGSERYINIRQFLFGADSWADYIRDMRALSVHNIPVDVEYGDQVLLLVTCEYTHNNGRFVVAFRAQREGESEASLISMVQNAH